MTDRRLMMLGLLATVLVLLTGWLWLRPASGDPFAGCRRSVVAGGAEALGGSFTVLEEPGGVAQVLAHFAREHHITQMVVGESSRSRWQLLLRGDIIGHLMRETRNVDVYVISRD